MDDDMDLFDVDPKRLTPAEREQYYRDLEEVIDSDEFFQQPWMQELRKELEREKTLVMNPKRMAEVSDAITKLKTIIEKEEIDAKIKYSRGGNLFYSIVGIEIITSTFEIGDFYNTRDMFIDILHIANSMSFYVRSDNKVVMSLGFGGVFSEVN